jgi:hypothetical protein
VKLDKLVEGAETYRRLVRVQLEPGAAAPQKQAIESGNQELADLEPKIPSLRLDLEPANAPGLEIRIDGERVPPAIVGVDRSANPGAHRVQVWAPGFNPAEANVDLRVSEKKSIALRLEPGAGAAPPVVPGPEQGTVPPPAAINAPPGTAPAINVTTEATTESEVKHSSVGFLLSVRAAAAVPFGDVGTTPLYASTTPLKDFLQPGGGLELRAGVRFAKYFTGVVYGAGYVLKPGPFWDDEVQQIGNNGDARSDNKGSAEEFGIGLMVGARRGTLGPFGELDITLYRRFQVDQSITVTNTCDVTWTATGQGLRLVGGVQIPVAKFLHISPYLGFTGGKSPDEWKGDWSGNAACQVASRRAIGNTIAIKDAKPNGLFVIGIGGDFVLGSDVP